MKRIIITVLVPLLTAVSSAWDIPQNTDGMRLQFSHCPSYKFTPLLISFAQAADGNTYAVISESGQQYQVTYTPDTNDKTATLSITGPRNNATIKMRFETEVFGTASMKWNGINYYDLTFRLTKNTQGNACLARMGDPVGDVIPATIGGNVVEVHFDGAVEQTIFSDDTRSDRRPSKQTPLVIQFPRGENRFTYRRKNPPGDEQGDLGDTTVEFEHIGCGAAIGMVGFHLNAELLLDFADSTGGTATLTWGIDDAALCVQGATFSIRPATGDEGCVTMPTEHAEALVSPATDGLDSLLDELKSRSYPTAVERLYQKRLLTLLPRILAGESVNTTLPDGNNTTALHNACGLSHTELVQWLVEHGADLRARTAKGARVEDCVGGANAAAIRGILRRAAGK